MNCSWNTWRLRSAAVRRGVTRGVTRAASPSWNTWRLRSAAVRRGVTRGVTRAASPHYVTVSMNRRGRGLYNKEIDLSLLPW